MPKEGTGKRWKGLKQKKYRPRPHYSPGRHRRNLNKEWQKVWKP